MAEKKSVQRGPRNMGKTLKRLLSYFGAYKMQIPIIIICILISSLSGVAGTYFLKPIINEYIVPFIGQQNPDLSAFVGMLILMGSIYLAGVITSYIYRRLMLTVSTGILNKIRNELFSNMQQLPIKFFDTHTHGELMSRFTNDTDTLRQMLGESITNVFSSAISVTGVFIMMLVLSPLLTILVVVMLFVMITAIRKIGGKSASYYKQQQRELGKTNGYIEEMIEGQKVVKVFCHEENVTADFNELNDNLAKAATSANTFANILMPIMVNLSYINYALSAAAGALLAINGYLDIGTIASFLQYTRSFSQPITQMSQQINSILMALAGAERIFQLIDEVAEIDEGNITLTFAQENEDGTLTACDAHTGIWAWQLPHENGETSLVRLNGDVRFENVSFSYDDENIVIDDVSLYAKPGQKIAFVGSTGAGKTTITNLINRFYDVQQGTIFYDGIDIKQIKKSDLRHSLAMVLQDTHLFTGTVAENIRYGKLDATDEEVITAAKLANAHDFIMMLPLQYDTVLTADGANLSQGQRQLLSIARAAVANPAVLILDEATSSIDTRTEALIEQGMDHLMQGRTVFIIAHRLSTVRNANAIIVFEKGKIIERGDHDDLLAQQGKYYQLYTGMFELE